MESKKSIYTMGEVAAIFDVSPSLIRHWESQFEQVKPRRNNKGNRLFSPEDVETLKVIYHLVRERGMTLDGAKQALKATKLTKSAERDTKIVERLQHLRSSLEELRTYVDRKPQSRRRTKSNEESEATGELFAFYEQRLF